MVKVFIIMSNLFGGGAERVMTDAFNHFPDDYDARIVTLDDTIIRYPIKKEPISLHFFRREWLPQTIYCLWKIPAGIVKYSLLLRKEKPDVSLSLLPVENIVNILACRIIGTKAILSIRNNPFGRYIDPFSYQLYNLSLNLCKMWEIPVITNSQEIASLLSVKYTIKQVHVIPNPKDLETINNHADEPIDEEFFNTDVPIIITVGRLVEIKGQWHLLRVFAELQKSNKCKLVLCGDGDLRDKLEALAHELHIVNDVLFLGWCENPHKYVKKSTIFAYTSLVDALPSAVIEALIVGCPIVSADCDYGPREILHDGEYGILSMALNKENFSASEPLTLAELELLANIKLLLENDNLRKSYIEMSRAYIDIYDIKKTASKYIDIFNCR